MRTMQHRLAVAGLMCVLLAAPSAAGEVVRVAINDLAFSPAEVTAKVGDPSRSLRAASHNAHLLDGITACQLERLLGGSP
jgi:plastocyanin